MYFAYISEFQPKTQNSKPKTQNSKPNFMQALVYYRSVPRYLLSRALNRLWPRHFFARVAPLRLQEVPLAPPGPQWGVLRTRLCGVCGSAPRAHDGGGT